MTCALFFSTVRKPLSTRSRPSLFVATSRLLPLDSLSTTSALLPDFAPKPAFQSARFITALLLVQFAEDTRHLDRAKFWARNRQAGTYNPRCRPAASANRSLQPKSVDSTSDRPPTSLASSFIPQFIALLLSATRIHQEQDVLNLPHGRDRLSQPP